MANDFHISADTLRAQAETSHSAGFTQLAKNLRRAAELTVVPNETLLKMYEALRPGRSSREELLEVADQLERDFNAPETAAFVREAVEVYTQRKLFRRE